MITILYSQNLQLLNRNDHHIEMTCRAQYVGRYLEGLGHSMTLQHNRVWSITFLFEVGFYNFFTNIINDNDNDNRFICNARPPAHNTNIKASFNCSDIF